MTAKKTFVVEVRISFRKKYAVEAFDEDFACAKACDLAFDDADDDRYIECWAKEEIGGVPE